MRGILLLAILCLTTQAFSQKIRFTDKRNNWYTSGGYPDCVFQKHYFYGGSDSIINGKQYERLNCWTTPGTPWCNSGTSLTFIREDSLAGKVFYVDLSRDTVDRILYNYNLNAGDSFIHGHSPFLLHDSISRIDTVVINGINHKVLALMRPGSGYCRYIIVEGVGCLSGPVIVGAAPGCIFEYDEALQCFHQDTTIPLFIVHHSGVYPDSFSNAVNCGKLLSVSADQTSIELNILPNPANDKITVSGIAGKDGIHITALNSYGVKIVSINATHKEVDLDCSRWPNGIYFIIVSDDQNYVTKKVVVQH